MVIYEVNLAVDPAVDGAYRDWLTEHIQEILELDGFESARWLQPDVHKDPDGWLLHTVQYVLTDQASLDKYFENHASKFRGVGIALFGDKFRASRRILTLRQGFTAIGGV